MQDFNKYLNKKAQEVEIGLKKQISLIKNTPQVIIDAMAYSLNAGGKRVRPILLNAVAEAFGAKQADTMPAACAVEMLHTYSLIHDDLPCMDNDDLRRGKPTNHKIFGEDLSLLAGDALLTYVFEVLAKVGDNKNIGAVRALRAVGIMANLGGVAGMIGGQTADIFAEGILEGQSKRGGKLLANKYFKGKKPAYFLLPQEAKEISAAELLTYIHKNKTGALISAGILMGAALAGADDKDFKQMQKYAAAIGFAFQVVDDILDVTASVKQLGKSNSDAKNKKLTFVTLYGLDASKAAAKKALMDALKALDAVKTADKAKLEPLYQMADFVVARSF